MLEYRMWRAGAFMLPAIRKLGTLDPKRMERFTTQAHKWYGAACYKDLPPGWTEPLSVDATEIR
jgi:hypothetical protein